MVKKKISKNSLKYEVKIFMRFLNLSLELKIFLILKIQSESLLILRKKSDFEKVSICLI